MQNDIIQNLSLGMYLIKNIALCALHCAIAYGAAVIEEDVKFI
jgi:hypothetical protein